jgi:hypothetical protein
MKIMVVFYSLHVCPWIPGKRKNFPRIFQENFKSKRSHFKKVSFSHSYISWSCCGSEKSIVTLLNFYSMD